MQKTFHVTPELDGKIKQKAKELGISDSDILRLAANEFCKKAN